MAKDNEMYGVMAPDIKIVEQLTVMRKVLENQMLETQRKLAIAQGEVEKHKEYLAKIEGGIDVLDQLQ
jgi:hypothetical protein